MFKWLCMKRIHFENMTHWFWYAVLSLSIILILIGTFEYFDFENKEIYGYMRIAGFLLAALYFSKGFWFKNYVRWNNKSIFIRLHSWSSRTVKYKEIKSSEVNDKQLIISKFNGEILNFDLIEFADTDVHKLYEIFKSFSRK